MPPTILTKFDKITPPAEGETIRLLNGKLSVPDHPIIPFIEGDGVGPDIWAAAKRVFDAAIVKAYGARRSIICRSCSHATHSRRFANASWRSRGR